MIQSDNLFGAGALSLGILDFEAALEASGRPLPDRSFLNDAIEATDINQERPNLNEPVVNPMQRLTDVCLYDEDEDAAERVKDDVLVTETAQGDVFGQNMLIGVELADMYAGGDVYETAQRFIGALPREQQQAWRNKLNHCQTQSDGQALVGEMFRNGVVEQYRTNKARQEALEEERALAFNGVFSELVKDAYNEGAWNRFREGQARGAFTDADKKSLDSAAKAWGMMEMLMDDYSRSGAAVLLDNESGERIFNELYGDEMAQAFFFNVLNNEVQDLKNDASRRNALVRFGQAFAASTNNLMAGVIGGKFKAFVTDEQVDEYNREWERARELSGRENPNVALYAEGDNWVEKYLLPGNARIDAIRRAAQESGQMNKDGSLRKMTAEERKGTQELGAFRGGLNNAVQGLYEVPGVAAKLGKMMPDSMIYLVPGGVFASAGSMHAQDLARRLGDGEDFVSANTKAAVEAGISAAVEKLAFGSLKPTRLAPGLDWLMSRKVVGQALGKIYGSTAGRIGLGVAAGSAEETFAEPLAGLIMRGVYNVAAADELQLADPLGTYRKEMEEMLAPDQILVTGLYGLLLGGVSAGGHHQAAKDYREMYEHLVAMGVDEGRAAQASRDDEAVADFKATKALFDEAVKKDTKGVIAYLAELYPQLEPLNVAENLFSTWQLPHLVPAENGQVKVQEQDEDGKVTETLMSKEAADLLVQARLEQMKSSEIARFADQLLGVAMAGKASTETDRFIVEEVEGAMDADYFTRLANAAGVRLQQGARADAVAPDIHQHLTLGQLVQQGKAWEQRMEIQRNEVDQERAKKNLPPLTDEEWTERKKNYVAAVNRQSVRGADGRMRTLLRVARGNYGAMNVLEDLTEDFVARDMQANNRELEWYAQNIRELETALGQQNEFLRELGEGKKPLNQMDIIEAVGKIAQSKLLADTVKGEHGFSAALKSFLEMIRSLILKAAAMLKLGKAINQALSDEQVREKMDADFLQLVDDVVAQDIEYLRELQLEDGLKAMQRVIAARQQAKADTRVKRRRKAHTPVLDKAEKNHGKKVREAARKKRRQQARVDADVEVAEAALEGDFSSSVLNQEELDAIKASAEKDGTFMKAPNGEPTRLTEQQWLQVRTGAFKQWFGDWEKVARFRAVRDTIMSMPIVTEITGKEFQSDGVPLTDKVPAYWQGAYQGWVVSPELGRVVLDKEGVKSSMGHGIGALKAAAFYAVPEVIQKGKVFDRQQNWKGRGYDTAVLAAPISIAGKEYICEVIVEQRPNRQGFYLHEVEVKEKLGNVFKTATQGSTRQASRSILALRDAEVNTIWENCSKVVDENGEPLVVYHGTPTGGFTIFRDESYFSPLMWYAEKYKNPSASSNRSSRDVGTPMLYEVFLNIRKPFDTRNAVEKKIFESDFFRKWGNGSPLSERGLPDWTDATDLLEFIEENELDYDGLILDEGGYPDGNGGVILRGHSFVPVTPNQIKSATDNRGTFDGSEADITMSMERNLAAVHSIPLDTMLQVEKTLGGLAKPSVAITRLDKPYSWGGDTRRVYLIGRPELADPQKGNLVYDRDAWTGKGPFLMESGGAYDYRKGEYFEPTLEEFVARTIKKKGMEEGSDLRAQSAVPVSTMEAVKAHRDMLTDTDTSNLQKQETEAALDSLIEDVVNLSKKGLNYEAVAYILAKICWRSSPMEDGAPSQRDVTRDQAKRILNEMGIRVKDIKKPLVDKFVKAVGGLKNELEDYLESVPQRAVMFNEFEYAVMPESAKETAGLNEMLQRNGIKPIFHDGTEEGRKAALAGLVNDAKVSFSVVGEHAANWDKIKDRAFRGRDDGKLRVELDASQAKVKSFPNAYPVQDVMRKLIHDGVYDSEDYMVYSSLAFAEDMTREERGERKLSETELKEDCDEYPDLAEEVELGLKAAGLTWESDVQEARGACFTALGKWKKTLDAELKQRNIEKPTGEAWHALVEQKPGLGSANVGKRVVSAWSGKWLDDVLDFPELYKAYPQLRSIQLAEDTGMELADASYADFARRHGAKAGKEDGQYPFGFINMNPKSSAWSNEQEAKGLLLHEVQHAIQGIEGFAKGGNPKTVREAVEKLLENDGFRIEWLERDLRWFSAVDIARDFLKEARMLRRYPNAWKRSGQRFRFARMSSTADEVREAILRDIAERYEAFRRDDTSETLLLDMNDSLLPVVRFSSLESIEAGLEKLKMLKSRKQAFRGTSAKKGRKLADLQKRYDRMKRVLDKFKYEPFELYRRMAGEIESRNVELRRDWTAEQRAARPFNSTLEYPGEAIVSFSVSDTLMEDIARARKRAKNADGTISQDGEMSRNEEVELCTMPDFMRFLGEPDVPVVARVFALRKLLTDHKLTDALTYEVVQKINDPVLAIQETPSKLLLLLPMDAENKTGNVTPVVALIEHKQDKDGNRYLVSAYPLEDDKETKVTNQFKKLVYCKYNTTAKFTANAPQGRAYDLLRAAISGGHTSNVPCKEDVVKWQQDFSSSLVNLDEESVAREVVDAGQGFRANLAYSEAIMREMRGAMQRLRRLGSKTRTDREDAVAAMGTMVQMVKAAVAVLPKGYRFSVHPYLNRIEALAELAATGDIDLTSDIAGKDIQQLENAEGVDLKKPFDEMVKEYGNVKLAEALERIMHRVSEQLRKHAKDRAVEKITELVERLAPKKDPKTGKLKGGKMSADAYRDLATVDKAMKMNAEQLEAKLAALRADLAKPGISEVLRGELEDEMILYDQYGDLAGMTPEDAVAAYEALRVRVYFHRFEWDDKQARVRGARRAVVRRVVDGVGSVSQNEYNAKKRRVKPTKRLKNLGDILSGMPAALAGLRGYLPLRQMADELALRANAAGEAIKAWEAERWEALEALSLETMGKSWRECMDFMHKVQPSGVSFDRPEFRTVNVKTEELRELLEMTKEEREAEMKRRREAGGLEAERELSERDVQELQKKLEQMEEDGRVLSRVETRYLKKIHHEENLHLSRGEALYAILMFEQPTYTERLIMQGYTFKVIEGLREYVGDGMLQFGYGLRELFAKQGDRIAAVYENAFGVPFPREENYFAARWVVTGMRENSAEQLLAGMAGTAGAGNGWMKQRVNHNLELDMTKDALQVFLQATSLTDTWMATQDIVADFKAWTRDADFERAMTALLGEESYTNLQDWIRILEEGGVQDCLNMGVSQDVINGLYGSGAVAILGLRVQTLLKQTPAIFNGLLGAHDISAAEWFATLSKMKHGDAPMTYSRMVNSTLMKMRQQGKAGNMAGQAVRSGDTASSAAEGLLQASMLPMEWVDARCTAIGLVPVWNVYYQRAVSQGASAQEAEQAAWEQTALVANLSSQPIGWLNKIKVAQSRNPIVKSAFYMLSENTAKFALCRALWRGGKKKAAFRAWLVYGAANAAISAMLDALQGDPEEFEKGKWWEYALSAFYGPASGIPGVGEALEAAVNALLNLTGEVADIDWMKKVKTRASAGRALVDIQGSAKALERVWGYMTDNKEHSLAEYTRAAGTVSRTLSIGTGWMGNMFGYWSTAVAVLMNPIDFGARVWRNMKHYWD